jgi:hypothetical protein
MENNPFILMWICIFLAMMTTFYIDAINKLEDARKYGPRLFDTDEMVYKSAFIATTLTILITFIKYITVLII